MTNQKHFITPPDDLIKQWLGEFFGRSMVDAELSDSERYIAAKSSQFGADYELEACIHMLSKLGGNGEMIRRMRRPKPLSLKKEALQAARIELIEGGKNAELILRALEALPDD